MDLRIVKTKRAIKHAFLELRETMPLEKLRVTDICSIATINKTTFYKHYHDIFTLSAELEDEAIALVMESFSAKDEIFRNPMYFLTELPIALDVNKEILRPLFHDNFDKLFILFEKQLKNRYGTADSTEEEDILLTFAIGGTLHTLRSMKFERDCDDTVLAENVSKILAKMGELRSKNRIES